jgi:S-adenosylmethionine hydrolase
MSASFHGRDLYAPIAAMLATGTTLQWRPHQRYAGAESWPDDLPAIIFIDHYGNAMTGLRGEVVSHASWLDVAGRQLGPARTFADVHEGDAFWHVSAHVPVS